MTMLLNLILLLLCGGDVDAASPSTVFLKLPVDARASGMGEGYVAAARGVGSMAHNPAGLAAMDIQEFTATYAPHLRGARLGFIAYARPIRSGVLSMSYRTLRTDALEGRDENGKPTGGFTAEDRAVALSFSRGWPRGDSAGIIGDDRNRLRLGGSLKYIGSRLASYTASSYAADAGLQLDLGPGGQPSWTIGAAVRNLGRDLKYIERHEPLPVDGVLGAALRHGEAWTIAAALAYRPREREMVYSLGGEFAPARRFFLRGQYGLVRARGVVGPEKVSLSGGVGIRFGICRMDYAFASLGEMGSTQRVSLTLRYGRSRHTATERRDREAFSEFFFAR